MYDFSSTRKGISDEQCRELLLSESGNELRSIISCIESIMNEKGEEGLTKLIKYLLASNSRSSQSILTLVLSYLSSKDVKLTVKIISSIVRNTSLPINKLVKSASAALGLDRLIILGSKHGILSRRFINAVLDELSCKELTILTNMVGIITIDKESLIKVLGRALSTTYCRQAKQAALEVIAKTLSKGSLGMGDLVDMLQKLNLKLLIIKDKKGKVKEVRVIHKSIEKFALITGLEDIVSRLAIASS